MRDPVANALITSLRAAGGHFVLVDRDTFLLSGPDEIKTPDVSKALTALHAPIISVLLDAAAAECRVPCAGCLQFVQLNPELMQEAAKPGMVTQCADCHHNRLSFCRLAVEVRRHYGTRALLSCN